MQIYNDAFIAILRDRHPSLLGQMAAAGWGDLFEELEPLLIAARSGKAMQPRDNVIYVEGPSGLEQLVFDADWSVLRDERGEVAGVLETLVETTQRHNAEAALRESEARHGLLVGSWAQAVWETDARGMVVTDSPSWRAYTGQRLREWLGYGWLNAVHPMTEPMPIDNGTMRSMLANWSMPNSGYVRPMEAGAGPTFAPLACSMRKERSKNGSG